MRINKYVVAVIMTEVCCLETNGSAGSGSVERGITERTKELVTEWLTLDQVRTPRVCVCLWLHACFIYAVIWCQSATSRAVIQRLADEENEGELNCRLGSRMAFGTAGTYKTVTVL